MLIEGATGPNLGGINGAFEVAERPDNEPPIYRRADGRDWWLFVNKDDKWEVGSKESKDARKTSSARTAHLMEAAQGRLPHEVGTLWKVWDDREMAEQQLRVLHGVEAEAVIAEVCVYAHMHAPCARASTHTCRHTNRWPLTYSSRSLSPPICILADQWPTDVFFRDLHHARRWAI